MNKGNRWPRIYKVGWIFLTNYWFRSSRDQMSFRRWPITSSHGAVMNSDFVPNCTNKFWWDGLHPPQTKTNSIEKISSTLLDRDTQEFWRKKNNKKSVATTVIISFRGYLDFFKIFHTQLNFKAQSSWLNKLENFSDYCHTVHTLFLNGRTFEFY